MLQKETYGVHFATEIDSLFTQQLAYGVYSAVFSAGIVTMQPSYSQEAHYFVYVVYNTCKIKKT